MEGFYPGVCPKEKSKIYMPYINVMSFVQNINTLTLLTKTGFIFSFLKPFVRQ